MCRLHPKIERGRSERRTLIPSTVQREAAEAYIVSQREEVAG